jgi:hypothetical protein
MEGLCGSWKSLSIATTYCGSLYTENSLVNCYMVFSWHLNRSTSSQVHCVILCTIIWSYSKTGFYLYIFIDEIFYEADGAIGKPPWLFQQVISLILLWVLFWPYLHMVWLVIDQSLYYGALCTSIKPI